MSATADKARYFLEQSVPELRELERKKIFSTQEISAIAKKRSDFEHKVNARGSSPSDYAQYAEFEINVDQLRRKRIKRLGAKATLHSGQRRIFFVFDRGNRKFPGDLTLWMQSIQYARSQKALKKVTQMLTNALRLHPTKADLWIYAAQFALEENGDMTEARSYMQRGLRFCKNAKELWLQHFRLELNWIAKIHARRRILGIEGDAAREEEVKIAGSEDIMMLPKLTAEDIAPSDEQLQKIDVDALKNLDMTPVMTGAIAMAIFDAAMEQFPQNLDLGLRFFSEAAKFEGLPPVETILSHIHDTLQQINETAWQSCAVKVLLPTATIAVDDHRFPSALRLTFAAISEGLAKTKQQTELLAYSRGFLSDLGQQDLDPALAMVLQSRLQALL